MTTLDKIKKVITEEKDNLAKTYNVSRIGVFGSVVRGEDTEKSDVDILVDFSKPIGIFDFIDLEEYLSDKINKKVDLVSRKALKPNIGKRVINEVVYL